MHAATATTYIHAYRYWPCTPLLTLLLLPPHASHLLLHPPASLALPTKVDRAQQAGGRRGRFLCNHMEQISPLAFLHLNRVDLLHLYRVDLLHLYRVDVASVASVVVVADGAGCAAECTDRRQNRGSTQCFVGQLVMVRLHQDPCHDSLIGPGESQIGGRSANLPQI